LNAGTGTAAPRPAAGMRLRSLRFRLLLLLLIIAAACGVAGHLMIGMFHLSVAAQIDRASVILGKGCSKIAERYRFYALGWNGVQNLQNDALKRDLRTVVNLALRDELGVEGGIWQGEAGPLAYAYPTYEGGGTKTDIPAAEFDRIKTINQAAVGADEPREARYAGRSQTLLIRACPLTGPVPNLTAWTMTRVFTAAWEGYANLRNGLLLLFGCVVAAAVLVARMLQIWSRQISSIERRLAAEGSGLAPLPLTGEQELDRIILALNQAGERLREARRQSDRLNRQVATAERLASIGRLSAALAHEIRNPFAAMRLKAENALAQGSAPGGVLNAIIGQIDRLDHLVEKLLTASSAETPKSSSIVMQAFLEDAVEPYRDLARSKGLALTVSSQAGEATLDQELTRRALENLITNALEHTDAGGQITVEARPVQHGVVIEVRDTGPGVAPEIAESLFETFVTGRSDGTGLGLTIAAEAIRSQGGSLRHVPSGKGAVFQIELRS
jgi:signal transduction histidine kinase